MPVVLAQLTGSRASHLSIQREVDNLSLRPMRREKSREQLSDNSHAAIAQAVTK